MKHDIWKTLADITENSVTTNKDVIRNDTMITNTTQTVDSRTLTY